jgi:hypothetical protein
LVVGGWNTAAVASGEYGTYGSWGDWDGNSDGYDNGGGGWDFDWD